MERLNSAPITFLLMPWNLCPVLQVIKYCYWSRMCMDSSELNLKVVMGSGAMACSQKPRMLAGWEQMGPGFWAAPWLAWKPGIYKGLLEKGSAFGLGDFQGLLPLKHWRS